MVALSSGDRHPFLAQDIADLALRDGHFELRFEQLGQFLLGQGGVLLLLALAARPVALASPWKRDRDDGQSGFPGSSSLAIATAQFGHIVPAVRKPQFFTEHLKVFSLLESLEKLLLC